MAVQTTSFPVFYDRLAINLLKCYSVVCKSCSEIIFNLHIAQAVNSMRIIKNTVLYMNLPERMPLPRSVSL